MLTGQCVPYGEDLWWPIAEVVRASCDIPLDAPSDTARARICETLRATTGRSEDDPEVSRTAIGLLHVLGFETELHDLDPGRARDDALRSVQTLLAGLAAKRAVVLVLSDLHWADDLVLALVDRLLEWLRALPFVLLVTSRPELDSRWRPAAGRHNSVVLALEPLDPESVDLLVRDLLGTDASPEVVALLHERSGGNPFFVEELAALLRETGAVDGDTAGRLLEPGRLPVTLQGLVAARLDALGTAERNVLEDCAIVGASGSIEAVHALAAVRGDALDPETALEQLADRELLDLDGFEFKFANEVVRDVAYATLTKAERARRHAALGEWLAARTPADDGGVAVERVAHHFGTAALLLRELGPIEGVPADLNARALDVAGARGRPRPRGRGVAQRGPPLRSRARRPPRRDTRRDPVAAPARSGPLARRAARAHRRARRPRRCPRGRRGRRTGDGPGAHGARRPAPDGGRVRRVDRDARPGDRRCGTRSATKRARPMPSGPRGHADVPRRPRRRRGRHDGRARAVPERG